MKKKAGKPPKRPQPRSFLQFLAEFLTPQVFKQAGALRRRKSPRWETHPLVMVLLAMTWCSGDSLEERFETARGFYVVTHRKRKRPGKTFAGFQKAISRLPMRVLRTLAAGVRRQLMRLYAVKLTFDGFIPLGCDGSRVECPRTTELQARMGQAGNPDSAPQLWVTAFVHLATGLLWSWRLGKGNADERQHLRKLLPTLPKNALIVTDAAYMGWDLAAAIVAAKFSFLIRLTSRAPLFTDTDEDVELDTFREGIVYYWPVHAQKQPPLKCRLIRTRDPKCKHDVWLLTNVLDSARLSVEAAGRFYKWRWRNEGLFRTWKVTLKKTKLAGRTVRLVHREAEASLLAVMVLLAHADRALRGTNDAGNVVASPRQVLRAIRQDIQPPQDLRPSNHYAKRLKTCRLEVRPGRTSPKATREWPGRKPYKPPNPPKLRRLDEQQKQRLHKLLHAL